MNGAAVGEPVGSSVGTGVGGTGAALGEAVGAGDGDSVVGVISSTMLAMTSSMVGSTQLGRSSSQTNPSQQIWGLFPFSEPHA